MANCSAPKSGGDLCQRTVPESGDRCFMHDASGPPSNHGAPLGNDNAVGNAGGGAPAENTNAVIHGGFCDTALLGERLSGPAREAADERAESAIEQSRETAPDLDEDERRRLAWRWAVLSHQWDSASADTVNHPESRGMRWIEGKTFDTSDGVITVEEQVVNPALMQSVRLSRRQDRIAEKLKLYG